ncbi:MULTISPECIES: response regulator transcription factor [unclassified Achromobacter]|uniref:response regulator transcription factor n=1 Tax=unclassified Achromobacter TaxID=2626865 RepID=UPI000B518714|nr:MULTISPECIES: response regulator transcription factor [unclassified Achromobacter]OWT79921.1 DNA-binding response regulator [Achromobacter sp. HZ34]OWT81805.1 DNA-binding response regulator [Achromobacter sp. HZ28]
MSAKILTIEDDSVIANEIIGELDRQGFDVDWSPDGRDGAAKALSAAYDAITLDRVLPGMDGLAIVSCLRSNGIHTPVLMISALSDVDERVRGLRAGGDDYLTKPFALEEMTARLEVLLRRRVEPARGNPALLRVGELELDLIARSASCNGQHLKLLPTEFRLLEIFMRHPGQTLTRTMIFETVWHMHFDPGTNLIDVHVARLRKKVSNFAGPQIRTVRGFGYVLD